MIISHATRKDWKGLFDFLNYNDNETREFACEHLMGIKEGRNSGAQLIRKYRLRTSLTDLQVVKLLIESW